MNKYVYLVMTPEALVASHLAPAEFGNYLATGARKRLRGQAIFFETDPAKLLDFKAEYMEERLVPYPGGEPKRSVYMSIYRALEHTPLEALRKLYLATDDGKVLEIAAANYEAGDEKLIHLYQQLSPITTRVASKLTPAAFIRFLTDPAHAVSAPRVVLVDMKLNKLATDPQAPIHNLPYKNPDHLRECLSTLMSSEERLTKTVIRQFRGELSYRTVERGFFVGDHKDYLYYPFPSIQELEGKHYSWWRSALTQSF